MTATAWSNSNGSEILFIKFAKFMKLRLQSTVYRLLKTGTCGTPTKDKFVQGVQLGS